MSITNSKILGSEYKALIDSELIKGTSYRVLSQKLKEDYNFEISHSALGSYHKKHLNNRIDKPEIEQYEPDFEDDVQDVTITYNPEINSKESLQEMYDKQVQIVKELQAQYMEGKRKFPEQELKALKVLADMLKS